MGLRGPVPAPDNVRQLRGAKPLRRDGVKVRRLVLAPKIPAVPGKLSRAAAGEWRRVTRELGHAGVLTEVDRGVLVAYCTAWARMKEADELLNAEGLYQLSREKVRTRHPAWQVYREAQKAMLLAAAQLYLTPVARLRIPIAPGAAGIEDDDDADTFD